MEWKETMGEGANGKWKWKKGKEGWWVTNIFIGMLRLLVIIVVSLETLMLDANTRQSSLTNNRGSKKMWATKS